MDKKQALIEYALRIGDSSLILGQRMAEWISNGPTLEEDIAMTNISLDLFGQARTMFKYICELAGEGTEDDWAFFRSEREFLNNLLAERPNDHFGETMVRQLLFSAFYYHFYQALQESKDERFAAHGAKSLKEVSYHLRHAGEWVVRLGDGTEESHQKVQQSLDDLWRYTGDLFEMDDLDEYLIKEGVAIDLNSLKAKWDATINEVIERATLTRPADGYMDSGRLDGIHSEHLGHLLSEMQYMQRAYPDAQW